MTSLITLNQHFDNALQRFAPDRIAFGAEQVPITFAELANGVDQLTAGLFARGIGPGKVVGYSLPNCSEVLALFLAIARLGACAIPLYPMMPDAVRAGIFASMGCDLVVTTGPAVDGLSRAAHHMHASFHVIQLEAVGAATSEAPIAPFESTPEQRLLAAASSGTTGTPKSVWLTHGNAAAVLSATADFSRLGSWQQEPDYTSMAAFPLSTSSVLVILGMIFAGARIVFSQDLSPMRYLELAEHWNAEALSAPPSYFEAILNLPTPLSRPLPGVRAILTGMDFLHTSLLARLSERFPALDRAASGYGLVETSTVFMTWKAHDREQLKQAPNRFTLCPSVDNQIDVRDEQGQPLSAGQAGELWVKGPSVVSGYLGPVAENATAFIDGWFRTGDVACRIDDASIELRGRQKYLIKRAGKSIPPMAVQDHLEACPGVRTSAVVGVKHPLYGEMVWAFVVANDQQQVTLKDIMKQCRSTLPNYMVPDQVTFIPELPRGAGVGKLDREALIKFAEMELGRIQGERHG